MASSEHSDPSQNYDSYKAFEGLDPAFNECLANGKDFFQHYDPGSSKCHYCYIEKKPCRQTGRQASNVRRYLWSRKDGPFGKELTVSEAPTPDGTSGFSHLSGSRKRDVARWTNFGGPIPVGGRPIYSSSEVQSPESILKDSSHARPALTQAVRPSPIQQPRNSRIITPQQLQPMVSFSRRRDGFSPFPFPATQVFQRRDHWPIRVTKEDPNAASENKEAVARLLRRDDRNSREVIVYANDRTIPGTSSEDMAAKLSWYEYELINNFQRTFDDLGGDN
ncbi:hypothetical protein O181_064467 [Austropuccinia psidii MF-1]|uniref:Uncharacterized protein n=1 Tax=Austropuccinia psidii MF-1 TaxID=1389203 RepID=A0A9Q3ERK5_9BASI|nr:hypothetical protein [Austropuccinia psidii MF-1]